MRYIGVDAPGNFNPTRRTEPFGRQASAFNQQLVDGKTVYLEKDVSDVDQFGRLLRYVWLQDGTMVNALLVEEGYAQVATYPPDVKYVDEFLRLEHIARQAERAMWCDPSYLSVCIASPPPFLDCDDIIFRGFKVIGSDPHDLDGNRDGVGCE